MEWVVGEGDDQRSYICEPGAPLIIGPDEVHWNRVLGDEEALWLTHFRPAREAH